MRLDNKLLLSMTAALVPLLVACPAEPPKQEVPKSAAVRVFSASPAEVSAGEKATLTWEVEDATGISITTLAGESVPLPDATASKGTIDVPVQQTTIYVLTANGEGGSDTAASSVLVRDEDSSILCTVTPQDAEAGDPVTVIWNAPGASQIVITNAEGDALYAGPQVQGSKTTTASFSTTWTCTAGARTASAGLQVSPKILAFAADTSNAAAGGTVTLSWNVGGASSVSLSADGSDAVFTTSTSAEIADGSLVTTIPANLPANGVVTYRLEASAGETKVSRSLEVYVGSEPRIVRFDVPRLARATGVFNVEWTTEQANKLVILVDGEPVHMAGKASDVAQGVLTLPTPASELEIQLQATNARGGVTLSEKHTVSAIGAPVINGQITATPPLLANGGEASSIAWNITNARRVRVLDEYGIAVAEFTGTAAESASVDVYPNALTTTYTLEVDNSVGDSILPRPTVNVDITSPATLTWADPAYPPGGPIVLSGHTAVNAGGLYGIPNVVKNAPGETFIDIRAEGTKLDVPANHTSKKNVYDLGADMDTLIYGVRAFHRNVAVSVNGWLEFSSATAIGPADNNSPFPNTQLVPLAIAPYFDDLRSKADGSSAIHVRTDGNGLNRRLIVQWDDLKHNDFDMSSLTFQAQIYESGKIVFAYKTLQVGGPELPAIGVINDDESGGLAAPDLPSEGDTYTFFGPVLPPVTMEAIDAPWAARIQVGATDLYLDVLADPPAYQAAVPVSLPE